MLFLKYDQHDAF